MEKPKMPPCFVCGKDMEVVNPDWDVLQPMGLVFTARGNYGSTIFDPTLASTARLEIFLHDDCVMERMDKVLYADTHTSYSVTYKPFRDYNPG